MKTVQKWLFLPIMSHMAFYSRVAFYRRGYGMTENFKSSKWRLSSLFSCNYSHCFDRNCHETPKAFIFYQFHSFVIILTCQSNQKWGKKWSKRSYFGSFWAHFGLCGTEEKSYFSLNSLKCNIVMFLNRFYQDDDP